MAILCVQTVPKGVTLDQVLSVSKAVSADGPPAGGISHVVIEDGDQVKIFDVWESEEAMNTFTTERLMPAIAKGMAEAGMAPDSVPPPEVQVFEVKELMSIEA